MTWNFGDGTTSTAQSPSHTYAAPGTYNVTLTVTDSDGDSAVGSAQVGNLVTFYDDGPSFSGAVAAASSVVLDETTAVPDETWRGSLFSTAEPAAAASPPLSCCAMDFPSVGA